MIRDKNTDWMSGTYGIFVHYLNSLVAPDVKNRADWDDVVNSFDVEAFSDTAEQMGIKYVFFTLGQNEGYYCSPNDTFNSFQPVVNGAKLITTSTRDLPMEIADALNARNIKLILYIPSSLPAHYEELAKNMGAVERFVEDGDWKLNKTAAKNWSDVIQEYAERYGTKAAGWCFDGAYDWVDFNEDVAKVYTAAVRQGNPNAIVSFNPGEGIISTRFECESYSFGEFNDMYSPLPESRWTAQNTQWQEMSYLSDWWGMPGTRFNTKELAEYVSKIIAAGGAISLDMSVTADGSFKDPNQVEQMLQIKKACKK